MSTTRIQKFVRVFLVASIFLGLLGVSTLYLYGSLYGYEVTNALVHLLIDEKGITIDDQKVPDRENVTVSWTGNIQNMNLSELSGYATSQYSDDLFYGINDSGGEAEIYMLAESGANLGVLRVDLQKPRDWEDMASFKVDNISYLLIGDTGDNLRWHNESFLHLIEEPRSISGSSSTVLAVERTIKFRFPDGPRDCEGIAVDVQSNSIFLLSKRTIPAEVYRLPLELIVSSRSTESLNEILIAEKIAVLGTIPQPDKRDLIEDPDYGEFRSQPTALDVAGNRSIVITYNHAYLFERAENESWASAFSKIPQRIELPPFEGREAGAFSRDGRYLYVSGEMEDGNKASSIFKAHL